jgi:hypothetical protein
MKTINWGPIICGIFISVGIFMVWGVVAAGWFVLAWGVLMLTAMVVSK